MFSEGKISPGKKIVPGARKVRSLQRDFTGRGVIVLGGRRHRRGNWAVEIFPDGGEVGENVDEV